MNVYRQRGTIAVVMRFIPTDIPEMDSLGLPMPVTRELAERQNGMVLVVGAAGNGKSTSIASMVAHLNATQALHIVTVEDPIEFLHRDSMSSISQREVGLDTASFAAALRAALRQDPDVIFVGEIRDEETMEIALKAAETGHLVMATLHTSDAVRTVNRMLALMRGDVNENRMRIASCLQGIIAQRLLPRADGAGVVLASEVLVASHSVKESIRRPENNPPLKALMEKGTHPYGMRTFADVGREAARAGLHRRPCRERGAGELTPRYQDCRARSRCPHPSPGSRCPTALPRRSGGGHRAPPSPAPAGGRPGWGRVKQRRAASRHCQRRGAVTGAMGSGGGASTTRVARQTMGTTMSASSSAAATPMSSTPRRSERAS